MFQLFMMYLSLPVASEIGKHSDFTHKVSGLDEHVSDGLVESECMSFSLV